MSDAITTATAETDPHALPRRGLARRAIECLIFLWAPHGGGGMALRGVALDLSLAGARIQLPRSLPLALRVELELTASGDGHPVFTTSAIVRWCNPTQSGWLVGCQFAKAMTLSQMVEIIQ